MRQRSAPGPPRCSHRCRWQPGPSVATAIRTCFAPSMGANFHHVALRSDPAGGRSALGILFASSLGYLSSWTLPSRFLSSFRPSSVLATRLRPICSCWLSGRRHHRNPTVLRIYRTSILALCSAGLIGPVCWSFATIQAPGPASRGGLRGLLAVLHDDPDRWPKSLSADNKFAGSSRIKIAGPGGSPPRPDHRNQPDPIYGSNGEERDWSFRSGPTEKQRFIVMGRPADFSE